MPLLKSQKSAKEIINQLRESLLILQQNDVPEKQRKTAYNDASKSLFWLKDNLDRTKYGNILNQVSSSASINNSNATSGSGGSSSVVTNAVSQGVGIAPLNKITTSNSGHELSNIATNSSAVGEQRGSAGTVDVAAYNKFCDTLTEVYNELCLCSVQVPDRVFVTDTLLLLLSSLHLVDFDRVKFVVDLFALLLARSVGESKPMVNYMCLKPQILTMLVKGYERNETAMLYGLILRHCIKVVAIHKQFLFSKDFELLFSYVDDHPFDVCSDAFNSVRDALTRNPDMVAIYLSDKFSDFFRIYHNMLSSNNYVTKRQSLKLLSELLLDRKNFKIMNEYISNAEFLKICMNLMRAPEKQIAFEAFHCFKVFAANPNMPRAIHAILYTNQTKLLEFLRNFLVERDNERSPFTDEKNYLIRAIGEMKAPPPLPPSTQPCMPSSDEQVIEANGNVTSTPGSKSDNNNTASTSNCAAAASSAT